MKQLIKIEVEEGSLILPPSTSYEDCHKLFNDFIEEVYGNNFYDIEYIEKHIQPFDISSNLSWDIIEENVERGVFENEQVEIGVAMYTIDFSMFFQRIKRIDPYSSDVYYEDRIDISDVGVYEGTYNELFLNEKEKERLIEIIKEKIT